MRSVTGMTWKIVSIPERLILKKQHDNNIPVTEETRYKVVSIRNNAPQFIKTENQYWGSLAMMLPPPGWGTGGKPGGWQSGRSANRIYSN